jgi:asparagine synthase (glutamine-hydrolysing)
VCGIVGIADLESRPPDDDVLGRMLRAIAHRGPDGCGTFDDVGVRLGHRRLSILDPTEAGAQPMERHGCVVIHNGEIYNYLELADELRLKGYTFTTETDTEVMLAAYDAWGPNAVSRFNGMWAFALWDRRRRRLLLSRDRVGVKPLYFRTAPRSVLFASEVTALVAGGPSDGDGWRPEPQLTVVRDFLVRGLVDHSEYTFIDGIRSLPPGHSLIIEDGSLRFDRYWPPPLLTDDARPAVTGEDLRRDHARVEEFRALFDESVRLRLRSDVALGTCLSGGIDSSSIVATASLLLNSPRPHGSVDASRHERAPRFAFHARFPDKHVDESRYAELVARQSQLEVVYSSPTIASLRATIVPVLRAQGEPFAGSSVFAQFAIMESAHARRVKVLLDGQGGDEVLAGYLPYLGYRSAGLIQAGRLDGVPGEMRRQVAFGSVTPAAALRYTVRALMPRTLVEFTRSASAGRSGLRVSGDLERCQTAARQHDQSGTALSRRLWQDLVSENLPALLRYEDRNSMAFGIEARVPFLDYRLVEFAMALPDRLKISNGMTKAILRQAMADRLPHEVVARRDKVGFATPQSAWLRASRAESAQLLGRNAQVLDRGWVRRSEVERVMSPQARGDAPQQQLWRLLILELWLQELWPASPGSTSHGSTAGQRPTLPTVDNPGR